jgi:AcrR family transcriptional regulator
MSPKPDVSAERKQQIHQAALVCFSRKGYFKTTMDDIVVESGLSKGTLYWYFDSKKELFMSLLMEVMEPVVLEWEAIAADETTSAAQKMQLTLAHFRFLFEEMSDFFGVVMEAWALTHHDEDVEKLTRDFYKPYLAIMSRIIEEGIAQGEFQVKAPQATSAVILTMFDGLTLAVGAGMLAQEVDELWGAAEALIWRGLGVNQIDRP